MTLPLTSTCVGGRRPGISQIVQEPGWSIAYERPLGFTRRETQVMDAVIKTGFCTKAAESLGLSVKTIEAHMLHMRTKACADSNYQLIAAYVAAQKG